MRTVSGVPMPSCARGVGAHGEGGTPEAAVPDLREALEGLIAELP